MPPISSTIRSERARISSKSPRDRVRTPVTSGLYPVMWAIASARSASSASNAAPTVPWPSRPTLYVSGIQVLVGLAADGEPRLAAGAEHDRRAWDAVVVVGHGVDVCAGDRGREHVARPWVRQRGLADQHVPGLAVLAHDGARRARLARAVGE